MQAIVRGVRAVVATENHAVGDVLFRSETHALAKILNHSCRPNCTVHHDAIVATQIIRAGTEIALDYTCNNTAINNAPTTTCMDCGATLNGRHTQCMRGAGSI